MLIAAPRSRSAAAGGLQATTRVFGQTFGTVLVAVAFGLGGAQGLVVGLVLAICCAALAVAVNCVRFKAASQFAAVFKQIQDLHRMLGKKTMEGEIVREAVEYGRSKKWIACSLLLSVDDQ